VQAAADESLSRRENGGQDPEGGRALLGQERGMQELLNNKLFHLQRCANNPSLEDYYSANRD
jgi:hypothetical protein